MSGPLAGLRVVELAGIGPAPLAAMLLADLGAEVVRIDRPNAEPVIKLDPSLALLNRGKRLVALDLKDPAALATVMRFVERADVLIEGFRPGVTERLGLGPEACHARNPRLVYGRVTGWGQDGPLSQVAGHDVNYIALSGALAAMGQRDKPLIPLNLIGDFGGGSLYLVFGIMSALYERQQSGRGQVVDAAMIDGVASLLTSFFAQRAGGLFKLQRESNLLDGGAPYYSLYQSSDGLWMSIGAIEARFFAELAGLIGLDASWIPRQNDRAAWPALREAIAACFATRTRAQWCELLESRDACFAPVLDMEESTRHAHHVARGTYVERGGVVQPAAAPRFDRTPGEVKAVHAAPEPAEAVLAHWNERG